MPEFLEPSDYDELPDYPDEEPVEFQEPSFEEIEDDEEELCGNPSCGECYPQEDEVARIDLDSTRIDWVPDSLQTPPVQWTFTADNTSSVPMPDILPGDITEEEAEQRRRQQISLDEAMQRMQRILRENSSRGVPQANPDTESEGEEVPETPGEMPVSNIEATEGEFTRPCPIPQIRGVIFQSRREARTIRFPGEIDARDNVQVSFWDLRPDNVRAAYNGLREWLNENGFGISGTSVDHYSENGFSANLPYYFTIGNIGDRGVRPADEVIFQQPCEDCDTENMYPSLACSSCNAPQYCSACRAFNSGVQNDPELGTFCNNCSIECTENEEHGRFHANNGDRCPECHPRIRCNACTSWIYTNEATMHEHEIRGETRNFCERCYNGICYSCGMVYNEEDLLIDEGHRCVSCVSMENSEDWDEESLESEQLVIPTIPGREVIRLVGVEIEGANGADLQGRDGGNILARALYDAGLSGSHSMTGYHSSDGRRMTVHVERDSSVDWELVIGPLNVADPTQVGTLNQSVRVVRNLINERTLKLDMRAGLHVHVGADKVPFANAYNLHKLYMYMEDFLYRFGAAKWPYHRSVNRRGRDQAGKSPITEGKLHFARTFAGNRYYGLSFDNYFGRYFDQCECGARTYGLFEECECNLGKCTFEFRLFNTTANTRKLHAYLAICQALVAKAIEMEEITDSSLYPALDFTKTKASDMHPSTRRKMVNQWEQRIVFINEQLPLTPEEKASIHYCIMNCEMGKVVSNADILLETEDN